MMVVRLIWANVIGAEGRRGRHGCHEGGGGDLPDIDGAGSGRIGERYGDGIRRGRGGTIAKGVNRSIYKQTSQRPSPIVREGKRVLGKSERGYEVLRMKGEG